MVYAGVVRDVFVRRSDNDEHFKQFWSFSNNFDAKEGGVAPVCLMIIY